MGGYIGATAVGLTTTAADVQGDITSTDTTPELILKNTTETDADGGRDGKITFKGEQSGGEESTLAQIQSSHDGASDDEAADLIFKTNDGSDGASPTERVRIDSNGSILTATLGTDNVHLGEGAGASIASGGNQNTLIGKDAGTALTTGDDNVAVGHSALSTEDANGRNTAVGYEALKTLNAGADGENVAVGYRAGKAMTSGIMNTLIGTQAGDALTDADYNTVVGRNAMSNDTKGNRAVAIGYGALTNQNFTSSTDNYNVAVGFNAGEQITTGTSNTLIGSRNGDALTTGGSNTAVGDSALGANQTSNSNTAVGESALTSTTGEKNTAIGAGAGNAITTGTKNTIVGMYNGNEDGVDIRTENNQIVLSDGDGKVKQHMDFHNRNVMKATYTTGYGIYINNQATSGLPEGIRVGLSGTAPDTQNGHFLNVGDNSSARCVIDLNGSLRNHDNSYGGFSDLKLKENIADASSQWDDIKAVKVKKYSMKITNSDTANRIGVIAQDLEEAGMNGLVTTVTDKDPDTREDLGTETKSVKYSVLLQKSSQCIARSNG